MKVLEQLAALQLPFNISQLISETAANNTYLKKRLYYGTSYERFRIPNHIRIGIISIIWVLCGFLEAVVHRKRVLVALYKDLDEIRNDWDKHVKTFNVSPSLGYIFLTLLIFSGSKDTF